MLVSAFVALLAPGFAADLVLQPGEDFCGAFNDLATTGDAVLLAPGGHMGPCAVANDGVRLAALEPEDPPQIVYDGVNSNVFDVAGSDITIAGLRIGPSQADIDGIKLNPGTG